MATDRNVTRSSSVNGGVRTVKIEPGGLLDDVPPGFEPLYNFPEPTSADEKKLKLAEEEHKGLQLQQKEEENLRKKTIQLDKQLAATECVIEKLRGNLNVLRRMGDEGDSQILNKVDLLLKAMREDAFGALNQTSLREELVNMAMEICCLQIAMEEQRKANEKILKLAEEQKKEKENLHKKIIQLEKQLDAKKTVELEVELLRAKLNAVKHIADGGDLGSLKKLDLFIKALGERKQELEKFKALNETLVIMERKRHDELHDARKELVKGMQELPTDTYIGIKRMGELECKPFQEAIKRKYSEAEAEERATELCSLWQGYLRDPEWHPIKVVEVDGKAKAVVNEDDEKLKGLKENYGEKVWNAVISALFERNEYNLSGRYVTSELWDYEEGRKATLKKGVALLLKHWKLKKRKLGID